MRLASFHAGGRDRVGVRLDDGSPLESDGIVIDLAEGALAAGAPPAEAARLADMLSLIESADALQPLIARTIAHVGARSDRVARYRTQDIRWHAPVRRPTKIICLALNNSANADRIMSGPKHPASFVKAANALVGHGEAIRIKPAYGRCHPEPELALVVGRSAREIRAESAYDHVFGYTIHNDITSPTMRGEDTFHYRAIHPRADDPRAVQHVDTWVSYPGRYKCSDTFACMGPWLVTKEEIPDPHNLNVRCVHQGNLITDDNTANLFYKVPQVLAFLSHYLTLWPGDIVSLGTALKKSAEGGAVQNVDLNRFGGPIEVSIERLGTLTNGVTWV